MDPRPVHPSRRHSCLTFAAAIAFAATLSLGARPPAAVGGDVHAMRGGAIHDMAAMSDAEMKRQIEDFYAAHPARGTNATADPSDSFLVANFFFDSNHDGSATLIDTVTIFAGQTVLWKWVAGFHTVTSGTGALDPAVGLLFDQSLTSGRFSFTFPSPGTVRFFCRNHEGLNMRGVVRVLDPTSVEPVPGTAITAGFVGAPWPDPTRGTASFRFALPRSGRARLEVFDAQGRRIATPVDGDYGAGTYAAAWDGRATSGGEVPAGVYLLRLQIPGALQTRRLVVGH